MSLNASTLLKQSYPPLQPLPGKLRHTSACKGLLQWLLQTTSWCSGSACTIVNKTGQAVVLRSKYKDVWEGEQWWLDDGAKMVVPLCYLKSAHPYTRLGVFLAEDRTRPLMSMINSLHLLDLDEITLTLSPPSSPLSCKLSMSAPFPSK